MVLGYPPGGSHSSMNKTGIESKSTIKFPLCFSLWYSTLINTMMKYIKHRGVINGFKNAFGGLFWSFHSQLNFRIHVFFTVLAFALGLLLRISYHEWLVVITVISTMLTLELINTSIEQTTDAITLEHNPLIKRAKDVSAAAVLTYASYTILIGLLIFGPKLLALL